jgi:predicted nucleic acid-binding protein
MYLHNSGRILLGDFAAAAFASVISRRVRVGSLSTDEGRAAFTKLDQWMISDAYSVTMTSVDITTAPNFPRRLDLNLRAPDAVHIAICRRIGAVLANFDDKMTAAARALDVEIAAA